MKPSVAVTLMALCSCLAQGTANASELMNSYCGKPGLGKSVTVELGTPIEVTPKAGSINLLVRSAPEQSAQMVALFARQFAVDTDCAEFLLSHGQLSADATDTLLARVYFDFDSQQLTPKSKTVLQTILAKADKQPGLFQLEGHTDNQGSERYNFTLGLKRADAVKAFMLAQGVNAERVNTHSQGESKPMADNATAAGRELNRRVEITQLAD
ncbi:MAG: OmpA family protein [Shewanella sp.]|nr:OmpA family protein [Shewanella sp.]MCF1430160.1 OmpA family protein [Shewanella sp.]MCF1437577.1 OmpA family protein [Shewanella sp.]MCF1456238.1 OmpA family protein [Shewanella sp.]